MHGIVTFGSELSQNLIEWKIYFEMYEPSIKRFYKISKNPLRMFIWMQKSIEFHLPHYEIPQLSSH